MAHTSKIPINCTAGAIPVKNEKGELSMKKVKVQRYIAGKRPDFAPDSGDEESDSDLDEQFTSSRAFASASHRGDRNRPDVKSESSFLREKKAASPTDRGSPDRVKHSPRRRRQRSGSSSSDDEDGETKREVRRSPRMRRRPKSSSSESSSAASDSELSDDEIQRRRMLQRQRAQANAKAEEELLAAQAGEEEGSGGEGNSEEESSEYEEYSDDDDVGQQRLKPVFIRKRDRVTLQDTEKEEQRLKQIEIENKRSADEKKRNSVKLVQDLVRKEIEMEKQTKEDKFDIDAVCTEDENEEFAYEQWKLRELKRIKRDKEEKETAEKERLEVEKLRNMTEEERRAYQRSNPKVVTNKATKGKYKFLQKYFHRGAFYLNEEDSVLKQDFAQPTLEDHFDKTILPKIMQVKNFGLAGRTKYTHLVDQDTTDFNSAWSSETSQSLQFTNKHAGGMKDQFDKPSAKKRKY